MELASQVRIVCASVMSDCKESTEFDRNWWRLFVASLQLSLKFLVNHWWHNNEEMYDVVFHA